MNTCPACVFDPVRDCVWCTLDDTVAGEVAPCQLNADPRAATRHWGQSESGIVDQSCIMHHRGINVHHSCLQHCGH
jgi:hypothetical protein